MSVYGLHLLTHQCLLHLYGYVAADARGAMRVEGAARFGTILIIIDSCFFIV